MKRVLPAFHEIVSTGSSVCLRSPDCIDKYTCQSTSKSVLDSLLAAYLLPIVSALAEPSANIVIRSEHHFRSHDRKRLSLRKHVFAATRDIATTLSCQSVHNSKELDQYIGFIDHRANSNCAPIAMAMLSPPLVTRSNAREHIVIDNYGLLFGGEAFPCSIFSMHDSETSGAFCSQSCLVMILGHLANRQANIIGPYNLTYLGRRRYARRFDHSHDTQHNPNCLLSSSVLPDHIFNFDEGLTLEECALALQSVSSNVTPHIVRTYMSRSPQVDMLLIEIINGCVLADYPVVLFVNTSKWYSKTKYNGLEQQENSSQHAVCIVGCRDSDAGFTNKGFIVHDPGARPFWIRPALRCLDAAWECIAEGPEVGFLFAADKHIISNPMSCIYYLEKNPLSSSEIAVYFAEASESSLSFRLVSPGELVPILVDRNNSSRLGSIKKLQVALTGSRYWVITGRSINGMIQHIWIFDAERIAERGLSAYYYPLTMATPVLLPLNEDFSAIDSRSNAIDINGLSGTDDTGRCLSRYSASRQAFQIEPSTISSSSSLSLASLISELNNVSLSGAVDLFIIRDNDIVDIEAEANRKLAPEIESDEDNRSLASLLADRNNADKICRWLHGILTAAREKHPITIPALATYLPNLSSPNLALRRTAIEALRNIIRIGMTLRKHGFMKSVIIEVVGGTILNLCDCDECQPSHSCYVYEREHLIKWLFEGLKDAAAGFKNTAAAKANEFSLAVELEPGETYILNDYESIQKLVDIADSQSDRAPWLGLNLDFAHFKSAGVSSARISENVACRFVHGHICDLPGSHTRDQRLGVWTELYLSANDEYSGYMDILKNRPVNGNLKMPHSQHLAVELEGCSRSKWIHESIVGIRRLCKV